MPMFRAGAPNSQEGFTLIELLVVIALIGVLLFAMIPAMVNVGDDGLSRSARRLAGTVRSLFNESALAKVEHKLVFRPDAGRYGTFRMRQIAAGVFEKEQMGEWQQLPDGVEITQIKIAGNDALLNGEVIINVYPVGWIDETELTLKSEGRELGILINPLNGMAEIHETETDR